MTTPHNPDVRARALVALGQQVDALRQERDALREALVDIRQAVNHPLVRRDVSDVVRAVVTDAIDAALTTPEAAR